MNLLAGHEVGAALEGQVWYAVVVFIAAVPEWQLHGTQQLAQLWPASQKGRVAERDSPQFAPQWASCHPEPAHRRTRGDPLGLRTRWAWRSQWSPMGGHSTRRLVWERKLRRWHFNMDCICTKSARSMLENHKPNFKASAHKEAITCPSRSLVIVMIIFFISFLKKLRLLGRSAAFNCLMFTS